MSSIMEFDFQKKINEYIVANLNGYEKALKICPLKDELFNLAVNCAGRKIDVVFSEQDYRRLGKLVIGVLKSACADYSVIIIEPSREDETPKIDYDGEVVIAFGGEELLSIASYYASIMKISYHAVITEPCACFLLSGSVKSNLSGMAKRYKIVPPKSIIIDVEIIKMASANAFAEGYIQIASQLISLIDYKLRILIAGENARPYSYSQIRKVISTVLEMNKYSNIKEVIIYACFVLSVERDFGTIVSSSTVDNYCDALGVYAPNVSRGQRLFTAFSRLADIYAFFFANDFSNMLTAPNYNGDVTLIESQTGENCEFLLDNLKAPSSKRLSLIRQVVDKTREGFMADITSVLSIVPEIQKEYNTLNKNSKIVENISLEQKVNALRLAPYLSDKQSVLSLVRDLGLIATIK